MKGSVAFVLYRYPLGVSLMLVNSILLFAKKGVAVDVFMCEDDFKTSPAEFGDSRINVILKKTSRTAVLFFEAARRTRKFLSSFGFFYRLPKPVLQILLFDVFLFSRWFLKAAQGRYDYIFAVECKSLLAARGAGRIVYYNMELLDWTDKGVSYGGERKLLKMLEYEAIKEIEAVAIQSEVRANRFSELNDFSGKTYILPVAAMGDAVKEKGRTMRDKFSIPDGVRIVVYSGNIAAWAMCRELIESVRSWPKGFCLVLHTWRKGVFEAGYGKEVKDAAAGLPVYFSDEYLSYEEMPGYLSSADIAVMFYRNLGDANFDDFLFSSNKFAEYLKAGLPVVTFGTSRFDEFVVDSGIGRTIGGFDEAGEALAKIAEDYAACRERVFECYENRFRFERFFEPFYAGLYGKREGDNA